MIERNKNLNGITKDGSSNCTIDESIGNKSDAGVVARIYRNAGTLKFATNDIGLIVINRFKGYGPVFSDFNGHVFRAEYFPMLVLRALGT